MNKPVAEHHHGHFGSVAALAALATVGFSALADRIYPLGDGGAYERAPVAKSAARETFDPARLAAAGCARNAAKAMYALSRAAEPQATAFRPDLNPDQRIALEKLPVRANLAGNALHVIAGMIEKEDPEARRKAESVAALVDAMEADAAVAATLDVETAAAALRAAMDSLADVMASVDEPLEIPET